jgi:hypothetical protein
MPRLPPSGLTLDGAILKPPFTHHRIAVHAAHSYTALTDGLRRIVMSDLDEAKRLLEKIADSNKTKLGSTDVTNVNLALEILLKDYIQRLSEAQADLEKLTSRQGKST